MSKHKIRPGDTTFNKLLFINKRANAVKITITGRSTLAIQPPPVSMDCPASVDTTWVPPANMEGWMNIYQLTIAIQKLTPPISTVGTIACATPAPVEPNPRAVASAATCELNPYSGQTGNCTLQLNDGADKSQASTSSTVQPSN